MSTVVLSMLKEALAASGTEIDSKHRELENAYDILAQQVGHRCTDSLIVSSDHACICSLTTNILLSPPSPTYFPGVSPPSWSLTTKNDQRKEMVFSDRRRPWGSCDPSWTR
jgi:hypothetical protein